MKLEYGLGKEVYLIEYRVLECQSIDKNIYLNKELEKKNDEEKLSVKEIVV